MRLPFLRPKDPATVAKRARSGGGADDAPVQQARTQARRRLIGALVLLAAGVLGFPVLFETQPRPLPVDTPMLAPEPATGSVASASSARPPLPVPPDAGNETGAATEPARAAAVEAAPAPVVAAAAPVTAAPTPVTEPATKPPAPAPAPKPEPAKVAPKPVAEASPAPEEAGRFVVQVGAYNEVERMRAARSKLKSLGYDTYTQDVDTPSGKRTRVRVGPFPTRQEAEKVAARAKSVGMQANVLSL